MQDGHNGEGIVIKRYDYKNKYGRTTWAKMVTSEFKEKHVKAMGAPESTATSFVEEEIVDQYITKAFCEKVFHKIKVEEQGWSSKYINRLLQTIFYDLVREHSWDMVKKYKQPKIDYKRLNRYTIAKTKQHLGKVF